MRPPLDGQLASAIDRGLAPFSGQSATTLRAKAEVAAHHRPHGIWRHISGRKASSTDVYS
jgi:hypothetical protein